MFALREKWDPGERDCFTHAVVGQLEFDKLIDVNPRGSLIWPFFKDMVYSEYMKKRMRRIYWFIHLRIGRSWTNTNVWTCKSEILGVTKVSQSV